MDASPPVGALAAEAARGLLPGAEEDESGLAWRTEGGYRLSCRVEGGIVRGWRIAKEGS